MSGWLRVMPSVVALMAGGCQSVAAPAPAVLTRADPATMERLKAALAGAMGRSQIELGPGDATQSSVITVLPRPAGPLDTHSLAMPTTFRLELQGKTCTLVRADTGARVALGGVDCRSATR